jgi:hypothetical protein
MSAALLALLIALDPGSCGQDPAGPGASSASPEAQARWAEVCRASGPAERAPLSAFQLTAEVTNRTGVQSNDFRIDYRYLAPDCIRFALPSQNETGRFGPAPEQYWVKSRDGVVVLAGREFKEDRKSVDDFLSLARNYAALSNPARLRILALEIPPVPADLGPELTKRAKKLLWLALESPDFALVREEAPINRAGVYRVELGLREDHLPAMAIIRAKEKPGVDPLLVEFSRYEERDGFKLPFVLLVHVLDRSQTPSAFSAVASQEVYVTAARLGPPFTIEDFKP